MTNAFQRPSSVACAGRLSMKYLAKASRPTLRSMSAPSSGSCAMTSSSNSDAIDSCSKLQALVNASVTAGRSFSFSSSAVGTALDENENDLPAVTEAFTSACSFEHESIASLLLDEVIAHDPELGALIDRSVGRLAFARYFIDNRPAHATELGLWKAFVMEHVKRAVYSWSGSETSLKDRRGDSDLTAFVELLQRESWLLGEDFVEFQTEIIERAALH